MTDTSTGTRAERVSTTSAAAPLAEGALRWRALSRLASGAPGNYSSAATHESSFAETEHVDLRRAELARLRGTDHLLQRRPTFTLKHEWLGRVDEVRDETFTATLTSREQPYELESAELEVEELSPEDLDKLRPGAVFYWIVGYRDEPYGQRIGVSTIKFRQMLPPSAEQLAWADGEAKAVFELLREA